MNYCNECIHEYSPIKLEPCRSCVLTNAHPSFEAKPPKIITNEEWIKSLNSHDFAIFMAEIMDCEYCKEELHIDCNYSCAIPQWLEQEHKE